MVCGHLFKLSFWFTAVPLIHEGFVSRSAPPPTMWTPETVDGAEPRICYAFSCPYVPHSLDMLDKGRTHVPDGTEQDDQISSYYYPEEYAI